MISVEGQGVDTHRAVTVAKTCCIPKLNTVFQYLTAFFTTLLLIAFFTTLLFTAFLTALFFTALFTAAFLTRRLTAAFLTALLATALLTVGIHRIFN